jgi:predicted DNA-binding transcriptional regulator YafY
MVRQWQVLRMLESKACTVHELVRSAHASRLLIIRDLQILERAGFPLYDAVDVDGTRRWRLASKNVTPFRRTA